jgi:hypothetical protein
MPTSDETGELAKSKHRVASSRKLDHPLQKCARSDVDQLFLHTIFSSVEMVLE